MGARQALDSLETELAERGWLVGERFGVADLNIASLLALARPAGIAFEGLPALDRWLRACLARPAARATWDKVLKDAQALGFVGDLEVPDQV